MLIFGYSQSLLAWGLVAACLEVLNNLYSEALDEYSQNPKLLKDFFGEKRKITKELAAFSVVANAIMNLDQFLTHA